MWEMADKKRTVARWREIEKRVNDTAELASIAADDDAIKAEVETELEKIASRLDGMELEAAFTGEFDSRNALLSIHAGAGGTESQDWVGVLMRMYLRWAERRGYPAEVLESTPGEEAGMKTVTISINGDYVYGYLKSEHGVHRLVRLSPFNSDHARHTSFVMVEVLPQVAQAMEVKINPDELRVDTFRSSGPGGQHVQKTSTAVRLTHLPTGITASCQSQRSQLQNKEVALRVLQSRLLELERAKRAEERAQLKGDVLAMAWGNQIRSYVLHPYKMVKDHRTGYETSNANLVLDGELEEFIQAYLRLQLGKG